MFSDDFRVSGKLTIESDGKTDPFKDLMDYELKSTQEINVFFTDGRTVRFIRDYTGYKERLDMIEKMVREVFDGSYTANDRELYHRAQVLADIFAIFEYDGKTVKEDK